MKARVFTSTNSIYFNEEIEFTKQKDFSAMDLKKREKTYSFMHLFVCIYI